MWQFNPIRRKRKKKRVLPRDHVFKQRPELRGVDKQVVVFFSPCCGSSMRVFPALGKSGKLQYQPHLRCRRCHKPWKVYLLLTKLGKIRNVHLTA
jgi:hypothetical protein